MLAKIRSKLRTATLSAAALGLTSLVMAPAAVAAQIYYACVIWSTGYACVYVIIN